MGVVKLIRPQPEQLSPREAARKKFMDSVLKRADRIAQDHDNLITATTQHLVIAVIHELSEAYLVNNELVAQLNNLAQGLEQTRAELEALRRAVKK